jgi:cell division transport system ATP-binding protein
MIQFKAVSKRYKSGQDALRNINFELADGEMAFLTGHSGAGKSTLLKLISRITLPTAGQIVVAGRHVTTLSRRQIPGLRRNIGVISQNPLLLNERTVFDNVALPLVISGFRHQEIGNKVRGALDKVGLLHKERQLAVALSTGEQQRLGIARAVVNRPPLLLADEPTGNLDPGLSEEIMHLFEEFNRIGVSVLIASHDLALIATLPYRIMTLKNGALLGGQHHEF